VKHAKTKAVPTRIVTTVGLNLKQETRIIRRKLLDATNGMPSYKAKPARGA
jgi:hypothetical protein